MSVISSFFLCLFNFHILKICPTVLDVVTEGCNGTLGYFLTLKKKTLKLNLDSDSLTMQIIDELNFF